LRRGSLENELPAAEGEEALSMRRKAFAFVLAALCCCRASANDAGATAPDAATDTAVSDQDGGDDTATSDDASGGDDTSTGVASGDDVAVGDDASSSDAWIDQREAGALDGADDQAAETSSDPADAGEIVDAPACPVAVPDESPCLSVGQVCYWGPCWSATCTDAGTWNSVDDSTCDVANTMGLDAALCPSTLPNEGIVCPTVEGLVCIYASGGHDAVATCVRGVWDVIFDPVWDTWRAPPPADATSEGSSP
jgi:hypothetical protein